MISGQDGVFRLDDAGIAALLGDEPPSEARRELDRAGLLPARDTLRSPVVTLEVLVAGASIQRHRLAVDRDRAAVLLDVRPGLHQLMVLAPSHVTAALVRTTRIGPRRASGSEPRPAPADAATRLMSAEDAVRRTVLQEVGAGLAWRLRVHWDGDRRELVAVDADDGMLVLDHDALHPVSASSLYRVFSTALPPEALAQRAT